MGLFDFFKRKDTSTEYQVDYSTFDDIDLQKLWADRGSLTESARGALGSELASRGLLAEEEAKPPPTEPKAPVEVNTDAAYHSDLMGERVTFNAPVVEADDGERCRDPLEVARAVVEELGGQAPGKSADPLFVEAVWLLASAGEELPEIGKGPRRGLADVTRAALADDPDEAYACLSRFASHFTPWLAWHTDGLLGSRWPERQLAWCAERDEEPGLLTIEAMAMADPAAVLPAIEPVVDPGWRQALLGEAMLAAMDAGQGSAVFDDVWARHSKGAWKDRNRGWVTSEIRRLARVDLEEAEGLLHDADDEGLLLPPASEALFGRLAPVEPERALDLAADPDYGVDALPRLKGCHLGGLDIADRLDRFYDEQLTWDAHQPNVVFRLLVGLAIARDDVAGVTRALELGGPHAWQVVAAATDALRDAVRRGSPQVDAMLDACLAPLRAAAVAGRDASAGQLVVGHIEYRPGWLTFDRPRVIEALVLQSGLDASAPTWRSVRPLA